MFFNLQILPLCKTSATTKICLLFSLSISTIDSLFLSFSYSFI